MAVSWPRAISVGLWFAALVTGAALMVQSALSNGSWLWLYWVLVIIECSVLVHHLYENESAP